LAHLGNRHNISLWSFASGRDPRDAGAAEVGHYMLMISGQQINRFGIIFLQWTFSYSFNSYN